MSGAKRIGQLTSQLANATCSPAAQHGARGGGGYGTEVAASDLPGRVPLDIRMGLTKAGDEAHPLRWGILGAADISADWVQALSFIPGATVTAVAARSGAKAAAWAADFAPGAVAHEGYDRLAADPNVDIIYVGTITALHAEHAMLCIEAGKHVLVEKPMCMSSAESAALYDAAEAKGVMLQEGMWPRFFPATEHARSLLDQGAIGEVKFLQADFGFNATGSPDNAKGDPANMQSHRAIHNPPMSCYVAQWVSPQIAPSHPSAPAMDIRSARRTVQIRSARKSARNFWIVKWTAWRTAWYSSRRPLMQAPLAFGPGAVMTSVAAAGLTPAGFPVR
jgi:hypothetical protein